ncbi:MAG TPA: alanine racemase [Xanthomonadales bacterium]|nr:alanine racemase [Xanthomonadales bacterium]
MRATRATIHLAALRSNLARVRALAPKSRVMAVVKADGYGHGLERVARALADADAFGVASIADGERIRAVGLGNRIVVLGGIDEARDVGEMRRLALDTVVHHDSQLELLERAPAGAPIRAWLKLDTGMHRLGFAPERAKETHARLRACAAVDPAIVLMTHFSNSDAFADPVTPAQVQRFLRVARELGGERSLANSAAVLGFPDAHADWVRVGGLLYGVSVIAGKTGGDIGFAPAMTLSTKLIAINRVARGERIGYGHAWECPEDMDVGVAAIGYGDGYPRHAGSGTPVLLVHGRRAPIVGRVSMDLVTIDLRGHPEARVGDEVVLWGPKLPVEEVAAAAGTIGYELICGMTRRVAFVEDDAPVAAGA